jgi:hypothetical protein
MPPLKSNLPSYSVGSVNPIRYASQFGAMPTARAAVAPSTSTSSNNDAYIQTLRDQIAASNETLKSLQYQIAQQPRLPYFDIAGSYANARQKAENAVNPVYVKKLNDYLERKKVQQNRAIQDRDTTQKRLDEALSEALTGSQIGRTRTSEDVERNVESINNQEDFFQTSEGTAFDRAIRALSGQVAASGMATSGLGQQQIQEAQTDRNLESGQQVEQFTGQREAQEIFKTRTFEDLGRADESATKKTAIGKEDAQRSFDRYIEDLDYEEKSTRNTLESERLLSMLQETGNQQRLSFNDFIASLTGQGARSQDIAEAIRVYGGVIG